MKNLHRILTPIITIFIFPAAIFLPMFRIMVSTGLASGDTKTNLMSTLGLGEFISLKDIISLARNNTNGGFETLKTIWDALKPESQDRILAAASGWQWGIVFAVLFVLVLITALVLIIVSASTKKTIASIIISGIGIIFTLAMNGSFNLFAKPFLSGAINLNSILGNTNQLLSLLLGSVVNVDYMKLGNAYAAILLIFIAVLIFSIIAYFEQRNED